jgi:hypothetical protein
MKWFSRKYVFTENTAGGQRGGEAERLLGGCLLEKEEL